MSLTKEEAEFLKQQEEEMRAAQTSSQVSQMNMAQQSMMMQGQESSMIKDQLNLSEELELIENLLRGNEFKRDEHGYEQWLPPTDPEMVVLSDYGIHLIMNTITFYINKNTLLSNYDDDTICRKMEDFASDLADTVFMEYEKVFQYPVYEDCKTVLFDRLKRKKKELMDEAKFHGEKADENAIELRLSNELKGKFNSEIVKIKEQIEKVFNFIEDSSRCSSLNIPKSMERTRKNYSKTTHPYIRESWWE